MENVNTPTPLEMLSHGPKALTIPNKEPSKDNESVNVNVTTFVGEQVYYHNDNKPA